MGHSRSQVKSGGSQHAQIGTSRSRSGLLPTSSISISILDASFSIFNQRHFFVRALFSVSVSVFLAPCAQSRPLRSGAENTPLFLAASRQLTTHHPSTSPKTPNLAFYRKLLRRVRILKIGALHQHIGIYETVLLSSLHPRFFFAFLHYKHHTRPDPITKRISLKALSW